MYLENKIKNQLNDLGFSKKEIAEKLKSLNISGYRRDCKRCPIANYLSKMNDGQVFRVASNYVTTYPIKDIKVETSFAIADFIESFDDDEYPFLIW